MPPPRRPKRSAVALRLLDAEAMVSSHAGGATLDGLRVEAGDLFGFGTVAEQESPRSVERPGSTRPGSSGSGNRRECRSVKGVCVPATRLVRFALLAVLVGTIVGCGRGTPLHPEEAAPIDEVGLIVLPGPEGRLPDDTIVGCTDGPWFPASALHGGAPLVQESSTPGLLDAVAAFLDGEEGVYWPQDGWRLLHSAGTTAHMVHLGSPDNPGLSFMPPGRTVASGGGTALAVWATVPFRYRHPPGCTPSTGSSTPAPMS